MAQMLDQLKLDTKLWARFADEAKRLKKDPTRLLTQLVRDHLEQMENERLMKESARIARRSGLTEDDDIEGIIRNLRKERLAKT